MSSKPRQPGADFYPRGKELVNISNLPGLHALPGWVLNLQDAHLEAWLSHETLGQRWRIELEHAVATNHFFNCKLWREEDSARRTHVRDSEIVANKRNIDRFNQQRNDAVERINDLLLDHWPILPPDAQPRLHSETIGSMIDRLSILSLKCHHMAIQARRSDAPEMHRAECTERLGILRCQRGDLAQCLDLLIRECESGQARFKSYRQFKMYNDSRYRQGVPGAMAAAATSA